ncbi:hypothetical protein COOONC_02259 [Cooperia oncophora]
MFMERKRLCVICGDSRDEREMRSASATKVQNAILVACLSVCGGLKKNVDPKSVYDDCHVNRRFLCHPHYVLAAQYIAAEMESVGKQFQHFEDPNASGSTAYVGTDDIPPHVIRFVNGFMIAAGIEGSVTAKDICHFMSIALRRYHSTPLWPAEAGVSAISLLSSSRNDVTSYADFTEETNPIAISKPSTSCSNPASYMDFMDETKPSTISGTMSNCNTIPSQTELVYCSQSTATNRHFVDVERKSCCIVCGTPHTEEGFRVSSSLKVQNAILVACLSACRCYMKTSVEDLYDNCNASRKNICHRHFAAAVSSIKFMI